MAISINGTDGITLPNSQILVESPFVKLGSIEWTTDRGYVDFNVVDPTRFTHYKLYWHISHQNTANTGNQWTVTSLVFLVGANEVTAYDNSVQWASSSATSEIINGESGVWSGDRTQIWMAGNGAVYDSHGECQISVPNKSTMRAGVRGISQLVGAPRQSPGTTNVNYRESFSSVAYSQDPTLITGIRIRGWSGTSYTSQYGSVQLYGLEK